LFAQNARFAIDFVARVAGGTRAVILVESEATGVNHDADTVRVENSTFGALDAGASIESFAIGVDILSSPFNTVVIDQIIPWVALSA
jgi:hypothetical protein